jgi:DNA helicase-2/ATP-dependent DNA helicase PcrA
VLTNRLLLDLAEARPADDAALAAVPGLGGIRRRAYGAEILAVLRGPTA